jgi:hypothetical protein
MATNSLLAKYRTACKELIDRFSNLPNEEQEYIRNQMRAFVEQKLLHAGGFLPILPPLLSDLINVLNTK